MKIYGVVPARMESSRFPGKPLHLICDRPMVEHVFCRAKMFKLWDDLIIATCDEEIKNFANNNNFPVVMTSKTHTRCLDRVAEAIKNMDYDIRGEDVVVCVQGDEPMLHPGMVQASIDPLLKDETVKCTVLAMQILSEKHYLSPDVVKIVHDLQGDVLYTSRSPIPYTKKFDPSLGAFRIYGILAFRWSFLQEFNSLPESPLEIKESCDSNRIFDHGHKQRMAPYPFKPSFAVDKPEDILLVEQNIVKDSLWGKY